jgi:predicted small metal-binding protein
MFTTEYFVTAHNDIVTPITTIEEKNMAYSYACADCEGMEACPGKVVAETEDEVWKLMGLHAKIAHDEDANEWDDETLAYLKTLIKTV